MIYIHSEAICKFQVSFHVVFFDKQVSRSWVNTACIRNFSCGDDPEDLGKVCSVTPHYDVDLYRTPLVFVVA